MEANDQGYDMDTHYLQSETTIFLDLFVEVVDVHCLIGWDVCSLHGGLVLIDLRSQGGMQFRAAFQRRCRAAIFG